MHYKRLNSIKSEIKKYLPIRVGLVPHVKMGHSIIDIVVNNIIRIVLEYNYQNNCMDTGTIIV